jgi:hypothetical protein
LPTIIDPQDILDSFQHFLSQGHIWLQPSALDKDLHVHTDNPNGGARVTYVRLESKAVSAFFCFGPDASLDGTPCFNIVFATPPAFRGHGRAKDIVRAALAEMGNGFGRRGVASFYVQAIIGADNKAAQAVAAETLSDSPTPVTDDATGEPALRYLRKLGRQTAH